jgi:hypothetical protein
MRILCRPLKEHGVKDIQNAKIINVTTVFTHTGPPDVSGPSNPATRLALVIVGTVVLFMIGLSFVGFVARFPQNHPDAIPYVKDKAKLVINTMIVSPSANLLTKIRNSQGFELANDTDNDEEASEMVVVDFSTDSNRDRR